MVMDLHPLERKVLHGLGKEWKSVEDIAKGAKVNKDAVFRALAWLHEKGLADIKEERKVEIMLTEEGKKYEREGLPERQVLDVIEDGMDIRALNHPLKNIALGWLRKYGFVEIKGGKIFVKKRGKLPSEDAFERALKGVWDKDLERRGIIKRVEKRTWYGKITERGEEVKGKLGGEEEINVITPKVLKRWRKVRFRKYDVSYPVPAQYPGRRHFVTKALDYVRGVWRELGFKEMEGPLIEKAFWNFDALFTPQEHPARELQDTFYLGIKGELPDRDLVKRVKEAHQGERVNSMGWGYEWDPEKARELVLRTHTTPLSARTIAQLKKDGIPAKYFAVGKCFRNETLDKSHLFEFNQVEGIVVDPNVTFRHLLGYLKLFYKKLGFEKVRFYPHYFPYTEMSVEIEVYDTRFGWIELGGAGMFREEVVEPLLGEAIPVLAWGPGMDRMIMLRYGIDDIRKLYENDIHVLRTIREW